MTPSLHPSRRRLIAALAGLGGLLAAGCASTAAQAAYPPLAMLEVYDRDTGQVLPVYQHEGRQFVPGRPGARYALRLRNLSAGRVLVVLSVDGVNVISGETADWGQTGYVLESGRSYDINGWRKSSTQVAAFEFAPIERSYAALTGRPGNVGVIGMAVFRERVPLPPPVPINPPISRSDAPRAEADARAAAPAGAAAPQMREKSATADESLASGSRLGTGHGQREWSVSQRTHFERLTRTPEQLTQLEYDSAERLAAAGIISAPVPPVAVVRPRPFPANPAFVPDPPSR